MYGIALHHEGYWADTRLQPRPHRMIWRHLKSSICQKILAASEAAKPQARATFVKSSLPFDAHVGCPPTESCFSLFMSTWPPITNVVNPFLLQNLDVETCCLHLRLLLPVLSENHVPNQKDDPLLITKSDGSIDSEERWQQRRAMAATESDGSNGERWQHGLTWRRLGQDTAPEMAMLPMCIRVAPSPSMHHTVRSGCAMAMPCAMACERNGA